MGVDHWLDEFGSVMLATVVSASNSSPMPVGSQLVVTSGERFEGWVSGGCVESEVIAESTEVMETGCPKIRELELRKTWCVRA